MSTDDMLELDCGKRKVMRQACAVMGCELTDTNSFVYSAIKWLADYMCDLFIEKSGDKWTMGFITGGSLEELLANAVLSIRDL